MNTLVIIPVYNEEASVARVVQSVMDAGYDYVVVNDGSNDNTAEICRTHALNCINLPINRGISAAFRAGVQYAQEHEANCVVQFDGDGQHRAEYIRALVDGIREDYDIVIGSRFISKKKPLCLRTVGSNLISALIKATAGVTIADPTSGMRAFGQRAITEFGSNHNLGPEPDTIAYFVSKKGFRVLETQVEMSERLSGKSYLTLRQSVFYMARVIASILTLKRLDR